MTPCSRREASRRRVRHRRRGGPRAPRRGPGERAWRVRRHHGAERVREVDAAQPPGRPRSSDRGRRFGSTASGSTSWARPSSPRLRRRRIGFVFQFFNLLGHRIEWIATVIVALIISSRNASGSVVVVRPADGREPSDDQTHRRHGTGRTGHALGP